MFGSIPEKYNSHSPDDYLRVCCEKGLKNISFLNYFFTIKEVDVEEGYQEFLLRVPVVLYGKKVLDEGILNPNVIFRNFIKYR